MIDTVATPPVVTVATCELNAVVQVDRVANKIAGARRRATAVVDRVDRPEHGAKQQRPQD